MQVCFKWWNDESWKKEKWEITCSILIDLLAPNFLKNNFIIAVAETQRPVATHRFFTIRNWRKLFFSFALYLWCLFSNIIFQQPTVYNQ